MSQSALLTIFAGSAAAPAPFDPASMFAGGLNGWLFNGAAGESDFLQSSGGSVAGDGDPLGYISDLSGNANNIAQATGGSKPVCKINNGIRSAYFTSSKTLDVTFATPIPPTRTEVWVIKVMANTPSADAYPHVLSGTGGLDFQYIRNSATDEVRAYTGTFSSAIVTCPAYGNTFIFVEQKSADGSGDVSVFTYNSSGSLVSSVLHGPNNSVATVTSMTLGFASAMIPFHMPFSMGIEGLPDTTDLVAYLADTFGAWSPT